jgi:ferredoxin
MRVFVDEDVCGGHGVCVGLCPEVFDLSDAGYAITLMTDVPPEFEPAAQQAAAQCPTRAIRVE